MGVKKFFKDRSLKVPDGSVTKAAELTVRESIWPIALVTTLFFLWGFSYGLLDTLNKHFQNILDIGQARSAGLQAAYFGLVSAQVPTKSDQPARTDLVSVPILWRPSATPPGSCDTMATALSSSGASASTLSVL
jgi:hypothetical protein